MEAFLKTPTGKMMMDLGWSEEEVLAGLQEIQEEWAAQGEAMDLEEAYMNAFGIEPDDCLDCLEWLGGGEGKV
jgi:hypothetical protein